MSKVQKDTIIELMAKFTEFLKLILLRKLQRQHIIKKCQMITLK
jgi:hypothetical protein